jgi:hypothetical protein
MLAFSIAFLILVYSQKAGHQALLNQYAKNKGDSKYPSNYRPISLLSCFSKVFTSILNNRLSSFADEVNLISP